MTARGFVRWSLLTVGMAAFVYLALLRTVTVRGVGTFEAALLLVAGGAVLAALRFALGRSEHRAAVADPFARDVFSTDTVNIAHVRVAGVGGAGLVAAAMVVATQYPLTAVAVTLGVCGGLIGAIALILHRRMRHS